MPDYANGKIYKIVCNITNDIYIGSTTQPLSKRLVGHRYDYIRATQEGRYYNTSSPIIERGNYEIILIENVSCENKEELHREERKHIEANICVNKFIPTRTREEWREANIDLIHKKQKIYRHDNKDKIKEKDKKYEKENAEKIAERKKQYYLENKDKIKERLERDKEIISERRKQYYLKKKETLGKMHFS